MLPSSSVNSQSQDLTDRAQTAARWISEFERVYVFGSARMRGDTLPARRPSGSYRVSGPPRR